MPFLNPVKIEALLFDAFRICADWRSAIIREGLTLPHKIDCCTSIAVHSPMLGEVSIARSAARDGRAPSATTSTVGASTWLRASKACREFRRKRSTSSTACGIDSILGRISSGSDPSRIALHHRAEFERSNCFASKHGQACQDSVGRDPGRRGCQGIQAEAGRMPAQCCDARPLASGSDDGRQPTTMSSSVQASAGSRRPLF
jgi:hypothetical protein